MNNISQAMQDIQRSRTVALIKIDGHLDLRVAIYFEY